MPVVIFDIGNVLLRWNPRNLYRKVFADPREMEWFLSNVCNGAWNEAQDLGRPWFDAVIERTALFPEWAAQIRAYDDRWMETLDGEISENVCVLQTLKAVGIRVYAITNFSKEKFLLAKAQHKFFELFEGIVVSGEEGMIKPDTRIFHLFLDRYGLKASDCVFIDDSEANVVAARNVGMSAILYADGQDLLTALEKQGMRLNQSADIV